MSTEKITERDKRAVFWRTFFMMSSINYERFQALGFCFAMAPVLKKLYKTKEQMADALKRHLRMFNTHPWMASPILGTTIALEEKHARDEGDMSEAIDGVKVGLMGPFAGIGDSLFWGTVRPILGGIFATFALEGSIAGPIMFLICWNVLNLGFRWWSQSLGYSAGMNLVQQIRQSGVVQMISEGASVLGLMVLGVLVASWVSIHTPIAITAGEKVFELQQVLDGVFPSILPLGVTLVMALLMRRGYSVNKVLLGTFVFAFLGAWLGFLG